MGAHNYSLSQSTHIPIMIHLEYEAKKRLSLTEGSQFETGKIAAAERSCVGNRYIWVELKPRSWQKIFHLQKSHHAKHVTVKHSLVYIIFTLISSLLLITGSFPPNDHDKDLTVFWFDNGKFQVHLQMRCDIIWFVDII